ncbi:MAG: arabinan endo-1,5-alpha-L-arabinosidase [Tidjanibacter sp.]|nr:arabinan endo-1,5-alpha-L-arabinosidase [Tidjanibacter sp.]
MKKLLSVLIALTSVSIVSMAQNASIDLKTLQLPEYTYASRVHDPVMIKQGDTYYMFTTGHGVSIQTSKDMVNWESGGSVFSKETLPKWHKSFIPEQDGHLWAPDIFFHDGKYYLYYSVSAWMNFDSSIGLATNTTLDPSSPDYKWVDCGVVVSHKNHVERVNVIDPNVIIDTDNRMWLFYGSYQKGLRAVELDPTTGKMMNENNPEIHVITNRLGEGVFIVKSEGYYYLFASEGRCCAGNESTYHVVVGYSENIEGPYLSKTGGRLLDGESTMFLKGDYEQPGRGHNGFILENGELKIVYHAYTRVAEGASLLGIRTVYQDEDGWPTLENTGKLLPVENINLIVME